MAKLPQHQNRIEELRKARGLTLEELAEQSGFSTPYVWQMAHGVRNISLRNLERLAAALHCQPEDLLATDTATNTDILDIWASIPPERRELAKTVLQSFTNSPATNSPDDDSIQPGKQKKKRPNNPK